MSKSNDLSDIWTPIQTAQSTRTKPRLTIYSNGNGYINAAADKEFFDTPEALRLFVDEDSNRIGFVPVEDKTEDGAYSFTTDTDYDHGGDIRLIPALEVLGVDINDLDDTRFFRIKEHEGLPSADVSELLDSETERDPDAEAETVESESDEEGTERDTPETDTKDVEAATGSSQDSSEAPVAANDLTDVEANIVDLLAAQGPLAGPALRDELGETPYKSLSELKDRGLVEVRQDPQDGRRSIYDLAGADAGELSVTESNDSSDAARDAGDDAAVPDPEDSPDAQTVRDCAKSTDSVQELAELLDLTDGEARFEARNAGVYDDLDDEVQPMGVGR